MIVVRKRGRLGTPLRWTDEAPREQAFWHHVAGATRAHESGLSPGILRGWFWEGPTASRTRRKGLGGGLGWGKRGRLGGAAGPVVPAPLLRAQSADDPK